MPVVSMDKSGKILIATSKDIQSGALRNLSEEKIHDGEIIEVPTKSAGPTESHLQVLEHNLNGKFVVACGDGEYIIYTAQALRNKSFGQALDFGWSSKIPNDYCVRDGQGKIHIFQEFKETNVITCPFTPEQMFGGYLVGVAGTEHVTFYTWQGKEACKIDVSPRAIFWSEDGDHVCIACDESFFILSCDQEALQTAVSAGNSEAAEACFEYLDEIAETAKTGQWIGDCFLYTNSAHRLNYYVGGEVVTLAHLDREQLLLGFLNKENKVFLMDKSKAISSYQVLEPVLKYQTAVVRGNFQLANSLLPEVPRQHHGKIARFLEAKGFKEAALAVATDAEHKFELALQLEKFDVALSLMRDQIAPAAGSRIAADIQAKWKQLGDLALSRGNVNLAEECANKAEDFPSLLLIYSSTGNIEGLKQLFEQTNKAGLYNISFLCALLVRDYSACVDVLKESNRTPEACFMALNHCPSRVSELVQKWKKEMIESGHGLGLRIAKALADPTERQDLFPGFSEALAKEGAFKSSSGKMNNAPVAEKRPLETASSQIVEPPAKQSSPRAVETPKVEAPKPVAETVVKPNIELPKQTIETPKPNVEPPKQTIETTKEVDPKFVEAVVSNLISDAVESESIEPEQEEEEEEVEETPAGAEEEDALVEELEKEIEGQALGEEEEEELALEEDWE